MVGSSREGTYALEDVTVFLKHVVFGDGHFVYSAIELYGVCIPFNLGTTGSAVCLDCFAWVALVDSLLCTCT